MEIKLNENKLMYLKNKKQVFGVYSMVMYRVQFQYKTVRGNLRERTKFIVSFFNTFTAVVQYGFRDRQKDILFYYIDEYNKNNPHRPMLDVEIKNACIIYRETNHQDRLSVRNGYLYMDVEVDSIDFDEVIIEKYSIIEGLAESKDYRINKSFDKIVYAVGPTYFFDELERLDEKLNNLKKGRCENNVSSYISYTCIFQSLPRLSIDTDPNRVFVGEVKVNKVTRTDVYSKILKEARFSTLW